MAGRLQVMGGRVGVDGKSAALSHDISCPYSVLQLVHLWYHSN